MFTLLDPRGKTWIIRVLPWGVLDGTVRYSQLSGCLVFGGRRATPEACYFERFWHSDDDIDDPTYEQDELMGSQLVDAAQGTQTQVRVSSSSTT